MNLNDEIIRLGINLYQAKKEEDVAIAELFENIDLFQDLENLLAENARSLSGFFKLLSTPNTTFYTTEDAYIESIHWAQPVYTSNEAVFLSSWWLPSSRGTKRHALVMSTVYQILFSTGIQTILGVTKQEKLLKLHDKIGYVIHGPIPGLFDGQLGWLMALTELGFKYGKLYRLAERARIERQKINAAA